MTRAMPLISVATVLLSLVASANAQTTYDYDDLGRLVRMTNTVTGETVAYGYDAAGNRQAVVATVPDYPFFSIDDVSVTEGGSLSFTVTKSGASVVSHAVSFTTADGSAVSGSDYTSHSGTLTFAPADLTKSITVSTANDALYEDNETLTVSLSAPTNNATLDDDHKVGVGAINNNDSAPTFSINNPTISEGGTLNFTVTKSGATGKTHTIKYSSANGTAIAGTDYTAVSLATLTFTSAQTTRVATVNTIEDSTPESDETVLVNLSNATGGAIIADSQGVGTIANDDNYAPVAVNDSVYVPYGGGTYAYVLNNDSDADDDTLTITSVSEYYYFLSASIACSGTCILVQASDNGTGNVAYTISDGNGGTDTGLLNVQVTGGGGGGGQPD